MRATAISRMFVEKVPEKIIMEQSGHLSKEGIRSYERTTAAQEKAVSDILSDITATSSSQMNSLSDTLAVVPATKAVQSAANTPPSEEWLDGLFSAVPEPPCEQKDSAQKIFQFQHMQGCTINLSICM